MMDLAEYRTSNDSNAFWRLRDGDCLNLLDEAIEEIERLTAIENALPKTADGVPIVPWPPTVVYRRIEYHGRPAIQVSVGFAWGTATFDSLADGEPSCGYVGRNVALCFSTREAAEAAERSEP